MQTLLGNLTNLLHKFHSCANKISHSCQNLKKWPWVAPSRNLKKLQKIVTYISFKRLQWYCQFLFINIFIILLAYMYLLVDFLVSKAMRAILWDLGRNAPEKFLSTLIVCDPVNIILGFNFFSLEIFSCCQQRWGYFFSSAVHPLSLTGLEEEDKRLY